MYAKTGVTTTTTRSILAIKSNCQTSSPQQLWLSIDERMIVGTQHYRQLLTPTRSTSSSMKRWVRSVRQLLMPPAFSIVLHGCALRNFQSLTVVDVITAASLT